jgi:hypothetical protein
MHQTNTTLTPGTMNDAQHCRKGLSPKIKGHIGVEDDRLHLGAGQWRVRSLELLLHIHD